MKRWHGPVLLSVLIAVLAAGTVVVVRQTYLKP